jgi:hypothetical protein
MDLIPTDSFVIMVVVIAVLVVVVVVAATTLFGGTRSHRVVQTRLVTVTATSAATVTSVTTVRKEFHGRRSGSRSLVVVVATCTAVAAGD